MSLPLPGTDTAGYVRSETGGLHVPNEAGIKKLFSGDHYNVMLTAAATNGSIGLVRASVPPGGGPIPHTHADADETFYILDGDLEFLDGDKVFMGTTGDLVHIPRTVRHRFTNIGCLPAKLLFIYTPGGPEGLFVEGGDEPVPGVQIEPWGPERFEDQRLQDLIVKYQLGVDPPPGS
jgi:quercetin dioxygenase-like cupin family protein